MLLANRDKTLFLAGAKGDWILSKEAYDGKLGSTLRVVSTRDGETISHHELTAPIVFDGMSAAAGRLYLALEDGSIACFSEP
jgi:hypothetical protein